MTSPDDNGFQEEPLPEDAEDGVDDTPEDVGEEVPEAPPAPKKGVGAAAAKKPPPRKTRSDVGKAHAPRGEGWTHKEAELMWPEMLGRLGKLQPPRTPYDIAIQVIRLTPQAMPLPGYIEGNLVAGGSGTSPGDLLRKTVEDYYHLPTNSGPNEYEIRFVWKNNGRVYGRGKLLLPDTQEIQAYRYAAERAKHRRGMGGGHLPPIQPEESPYESEYEPAPPPPRRAPPQVAGGYPQQPPAGNPAGFYVGGYPQQPLPQGFGYAPQQDNGEVGYLRQQVGYLSGRLNEALEVLKKVGAATGVVAPPAAPAAPVSVEDSMDRLADRILARLGIKPGQPGVGVAAAPPAAPPSVASEMHAGVSAFKTMVGMARELRSLGKELSTVYGDGMGEAPEAPPEELHAEPVVEAPKPEDKLPFEVVPIPETSFLGHPAKYAIDKETGGFSKEGFFMSNPGLAEKLIETGGRLIDVLSKIGSPVKPGNPAEVVKEIPRGAFNTGVGETAAPSVATGDGSVPDDSNGGGL